MNIFNYFRLSLLKGISKRNEDEQRHKQIIMKISEVTAIVVGIHTQIDKGIGEVKAKIQALEDRINNLDVVPAELETALNEAKASAQALDDLNQDTPAPTPEPAP